MNFYELNGALPAEELAETVWERYPVRLERIVSSGQSSPPGFWYEQNTDEWVLLLTGTAALTLADGKSVELQAGDTYFLPAGLRHRVERTSSEPPCIWLCLHVQP